MTTPRHVYLETMGCQMNVLDSELVLGDLLARGWQPTDDMRGADLVVLNTCSVRQHAEDKVYSRLGQLKPRRGAAAADRIVAVIGCMAERDGDGLLSRMPHVDILCGPGELHRLPALVSDVLSTRRRAIALSGEGRQHSTPTATSSEHADLESLDSARAAGWGSAAAGASRFQAYVRITRGCNKWCSFCVVPMTRGPEVHRPPQQLVDEVRQLVAGGVKEVTLLGQTVNHYQYTDDRGRTTTFADLLRRLHDDVCDLPRLRFVTSFPRDFTDDALRAMAERPRICRYLHIPAQSGSNRLLRAMNRGYSIEEYKGLLDRARDLMPDIALAGDMIVGFPGESEADFQASVALLRHARYKNCFIFKYSPRPGTAAERRLPDDVPELEKRRRNNELLAVQAEINAANHRSLIGAEVEVLVEGFSKAARRAQESEQERGSEADHEAAYAGLGPAGRLAAGSVQADRPPASRPREAVARQLVGRTAADQIVVFDGPAGLIGRLISVRIAAATPYTLYARLSDEPACEPPPPPRATAGSLSLPIFAG